LNEVKSTFANCGLIGKEDIFKPIDVSLPSLLKAPKAYNCSKAPTIDDREGLSINSNFVISSIPDALSSNKTLDKFARFISGSDSS
jgi:hypothetical protein